METLALTTPETKPSNTGYKVVRLLLDWESALIRIELKGVNGEIKTHDYAGATATTLMNQLNTMNLSTQSLQKRILNRLISDGVLTGTVTGSPD